MQVATLIKDFWRFWDRRRPRRHIVIVAIFARHHRASIAPPSRHQRAIVAPSSFIITIIIITFDINVISIINIMNH
jgi:hypothetical protein